MQKNVKGLANKNHNETPPPFIHTQKIHLLPAAPADGLEGKNSSKKTTFAAQMPEESALPERSRRTNSLTNIRKERQGRQPKKNMFKKN